MKKDFDDCLDLIVTPKIRAFLQEALRVSPERFWKDPCSSSNKYHPPEDQVEGGIIVHSRKAVQVAVSLFRFYDINDRLTREKIIAACIIHDLFKNGYPWGESTDYKHGHVAAHMLKDVVLDGPAEDDDDLMDIVELIENHMGIWNDPEPTPALVVGKVLTEKDVWHNIMQLADYWASRKWCPFVADKIVL